MAQNSTSMQFTLGTSARLLKMLTELGGIISSTFLLLAGLRPVILYVGHSGRPDFSSSKLVTFGGWLRSD